jgi:winged helix domain-containing protein/ATPase family protein associated with various cellular activities (AAA)
MTAYRDDLEHLADELTLVDLLIRARLAELTLQNEVVPQGQAARTVYISRDEVDFLLAETSGGNPADRTETARFAAEIAARVRDSGRLALPELGRLFGLTALELTAVVICLAPELRRKYDRLYAYLQDDITRRRPSVDLVLELLCGTERERWAARASFSDGAPLLRTGILKAIDDPQSPSGSSGLAQFLALDQRICRFLLGVDELDGRLAGRARLHRPHGTSTPDPLADELHRLAVYHLERGGLVVHLHGPAGAGTSELVRHVGHRLGVAVLRVDLATAGEEHVRLAFREALLHNAVLHLAGADTPDETLRAAVVAAVADFGGLVFLTGESAWTGPVEFPGARFHPVAVPLPDLPRRTAAWRGVLDGHARAWAVELASRYRLPATRIRAAVRLATDHRLRAGDGGDLTLADLAAACRRQSTHALGALAVKVDPHAGWDDLVLPDDRVDQLRDIAAQVRHHHRVFGAWGFGAKLGHGKGLSVLFGGPPGTGKTMAAEVLAADLDLDLYKVDLSGVVSKYVGETEKNLARVFAEGTSGNAILFFDEADALFGKRTEVSDAHDRYANIETSYLLQRLEDYDGLVVLATNLRQNLDEAFTRRIRFVVEFPFPEADSRTRIWRSLFPAEAPVSADVDFAALGREFAVAGGSIKNIVLNAAFLAAADGGVIDRRHILRGTRREFEKIGKLWLEPEVTA